MRTIKLYRPPGRPAFLPEFLADLEAKLRRKLLLQIIQLPQVPICDLKEPHFKHFVLEKYSQFYELREKGKVLVRIIFTIQDEDIILLVPFIKRQPRDSMRALERSLKMLAEIREHPEYAVELNWKEVDIK